jgi:Ca2+-binding EF-hand superfamily protein
MLTAALLLALQAATTTTPPAQQDPRRELQVNMQLDAAFVTESDRNGDGALSSDEFVAAMDRRIDAAIAANPAAQKKITLAHRVKMREAMMEPSFRGFDKNSDGLLTIAEIESRAKQMNATPK